MEPGWKLATVRCLYQVAVRLSIYLFDACQHRCVVAASRKRNTNMPARPPARPPAGLPARLPEGHMYACRPARTHPRRTQDYADTCKMLETSQGCFFCPLLPLLWQSVREHPRLHCMRAYCRPYAHGNRPVRRI